MHLESSRIEAAHTAFASRSTNMRHLIMSLIVVLAEMLMCFAYGWAGHVAMPLTSWGILIASLCVMSLLFVWVEQRHPPNWLSGRRQVLILTIWASACFLITAYFLNKYRISAIMFFFPILLMASFRLSRVVLVVVCCMTTIGYLGVLLLVAWLRPLIFNPSVEGLQWVIFTATVFSFVISGSTVSRIRQNLSHVNRELRKSTRILREQAIRDELTGLFNRRYLLNTLEQQKAMAETGNYTFSICYLDLDHFKQINDTYGHNVGDYVLERTSQVLRQGSREADYCGRLGGEEFLLILVGDELASAKMGAERLRIQLANEDFSNVMGSRNVTLSAGLVQFRPGETVDGLLKRADRCLYQAKENGRNCVFCE